MILQGNARGGSANLASHLLSTENEFVTVHELRGFVSDELHGAFAESYAASKGTRCKKFLYSLSLNPPPGEDVGTEEFEAAAGRIESALGLSGQPRALVFHEKEGADGQTRRHAHAVWSRIDTDAMKAVQLSHDRTKLRQISRDLYIEHGWKMPRGLIKKGEKSMKNFTHAEWEQAKRAGKHPNDTKEAIADAWAISDSKVAFIKALSERGYKIAKGDKRSFVAVDELGEVFSLPRMAGVKTKEMRQRLGDEHAFPSVTEAKDKVAREILPTLNRYQNELAAKKREAIAQLKEQKTALVEKQKSQRLTLEQKHQTRAANETLERKARFRTGFKGVWDRLTGTHKKIRSENERQAALGLRRDASEKDALVFKQAEQRRAFSAGVQYQKQQYLQKRQSLKQEIRTYEAMKAPPNPSADAKQTFMDQRRTQSQGLRQQTRGPRIRGPSQNR